MLPAALLVVADTLCCLLQLQSRIVLASGQHEIASSRLVT